MSYEIVIKIDDPSKLKILKTEFKDLKTERFQITVNKEVAITAKDAVALKSILLSVSKAMEVYEKMQSV